MSANTPLRTKKKKCVYFRKHATCSVLNLLTLCAYHLTCSCGHEPTLTKPCGRISWYGVSAFILSLHVWLISLFTLSTCSVCIFPMGILCTSTLSSSNLTALFPSLPRCRHTHVKTHAHVLSPGGCFRCLHHRCSSDNRLRQTSS